MHLNLKKLSKSPSWIFINENVLLNLIIIVLQLDYKRGMNGDIRAMVDGKLVKKTEGGIGEIVVKMKK